VQSLLHAAGADIAAGNVAVSDAAAIIAYRRAWAAAAQALQLGGKPVPSVMLPTGRAAWASFASAYVRAAIVALGFQISD
jgi:hypothetical protein